MGTLTGTVTQPINAGSELKIEGTFAFGDSYATGGETVSISKIGLSKINRLVMAPTEDSALGTVFFEYVNSTGKVKAYAGGGGGGGNTGATSGGTPAAQVFTGASSKLDLATPAFNGTGFATAGQVVTTTDNQTMTLNQAAGMWLIADALTSTAPVLIASNTAVTGAPAVLTVIGTAPATDAGTYKIVATIPVGTNGASAALADHTHAVGAGGAVDEVANATDLSGLTAVKFEAYGS